MNTGRWITILFFLPACGGAPADRDPRSQDAPGPGLRGTDIGMGTPPSNAPTPASAGAQASAEDPPPPATVPISGGTLMVTHDGRFAVASDPDRAAIHVVDLASESVAEISVAQGLEPGRVVEGPEAHAFVAMRGGAVATVDLSAAEIVLLRSVCSAPRGLAYDGTLGQVHVACATGELVTLPAAGGEPSRALSLERDLRDVVLHRTNLLVSSFRAAEILTVKGDGSMGARERPGCANFDRFVFAPEVAWRTVSVSDGVVMLHQRFDLGQIASYSPPQTNTSACSEAVVHGAVTFFPDRGGPISTGAIARAVVPVDAAVSPDQTTVAIANAGAAGHGSVLLVDLPRMPASSECLVPREVDVSGQAIAVTYAPSGTLYVQSREPAALYGYNAAGQKTLEIALSSDTRNAIGHRLFHTDAGSGIACATCHPEGGDDGRTWDFESHGRRRTLNLRGTLKGTAPYHWSGESSDIDHLITDVFTGRMHGRVLSAAERSALGDWLFALEAPPPRSGLDPAQVARGKALFEGSAGCAACHSGGRYTNSQTLDVGTGGRFQVPSLVGVAWHAPFLHDGCAATLNERFTTCAKPQHGSTSLLLPSQIADLVAFLESL